MPAEERFEYAESVTGLLYEALSVFELPPDNAAFPCALSSTVSCVLAVPLGWELEAGAAVALTGSALWILAAPPEIGLIMVFCTLPFLSSEPL